MAVRRKNATAIFTDFDGNQAAVRGFFSPNVHYTYVEADLRAEDAPYVFLTEPGEARKIVAAGEVEIEGRKFRVSKPPPRWESGTLTNHLAVPLEEI